MFSSSEMLGGPSPGSEVGWTALLEHHRLLVYLHSLCFIHDGLVSLESVEESDTRSLTPSNCMNNTPRKNSSASIHSHEIDKRADSRRNSATKIS